MKKLLTLLAALALSFGVAPANAQLGPSANGPMYNPNWTTGYVPDARQWGLLWSNKMDFFASGVPIAYGGTGATTAAGARTNLGAMSSALPSAQIFVGNASAVATARALSGDGTLTNAGVLSIVDLSHVTNASLANAGLAHAATTVNGQLCTLGSTCTVTAVAADVPIGTTITGGTNGDLLTVSGGALSQVLALPAANFPALTGDITTTAGTLATTLATVASAGTTGSSTAIPVITINAKGLTTAITTAAVVAPAGTLTGTTLASNVVTSSLTSVGTLASLNVTGSVSVGNSFGFIVTSGFGIFNNSATTAAFRNTANNADTNISAAAGIFSSLIRGANATLFDITNDGTAALRSAAGGSVRLTIGNSSAIPAGGSTALAYTATSTTSFGIYFGSGVPTISAAKGSWYLRSDGTGTNDRAYINTDGGTTWTAVVTAG